MTCLPRICRQVNKCGRVLPLLVRFLAEDPSAMLKVRGCSVLSVLYRACLAPNARSSAARNFRFAALLLVFKSPRPAWL
jgi:hypothetical protein